MNEHRVFPDKNVEQHAEQKIGQLEIPITPIETCKSLSEKIEKEVAAMKEVLARVKV